jgi:MarR family transcriptional regulator, organic hydroperoxide resistance regulator
MVDRSDAEADASVAPLLRGDVSWLLSRVWLGFGDARAAALEPLGITVREHVVITALEGFDGTQFDLASRIRLDKSVLTTTIDSLEQKGLVVRIPDPSDRRAKRPQLTADGRRLSSSAGAAARLVQEQLLALIPAESREHFVSALQEFAFGAFATGMSFEKVTTPRERSAQNRPHVRAVGSEPKV